MQTMLTIEKAKKLLDVECLTWAPEQRNPLYALVEQYGYAGAALLCIDSSGSDFAGMYGEILKRISPDQYNLIEAMYDAHTRELKESLVNNRL